MSNSKEYNAAYYKRTKNIKIPKTLARQREIRDFIHKLKLASGCVICGYNKSLRALQFHHHSGGKEHNIGRMAAQGRSKKMILSEIGKCICVCANCHAEIHDNSPSLGQPEPLKL